MSNWKAQYTVTVREKRLIARARRWRIIAEGWYPLNGTKVPTITVLIADKPVELLHGTRVREALGFGNTRFEDWKEYYDMPPPLVVANVRYFTANQVNLIAKLGEFKGTKNREKRNEFIREVWRRWWE